MKPYLFLLLPFFLLSACNQIGEAPPTGTETRLQNCLPYTNNTDVNVMMSYGLRAVNLLHEEGIESCTGAYSIEIEGRDDMLEYTLEYDFTGPAIYFYYQYSHSSHTLTYSVIEDYVDVSVEMNGETRKYEQKLDDYSTEADPTGVNFWAEISYQNAQFYEIEQKRKKAEQ